MTVQLVSYRINPFFTILLEAEVIEWKENSVWLRGGCVHGACSSSHTGRCLLRRDTRHSARNYQGLL